VQLDFELANASVTMLSNGEDQVISREYLLVKELPREQKSRYGSIPDKIYVWKCYQDLYELVATDKGQCYSVHGRAWHGEVAVPSLLHIPLPIR
jgi:hypothetical protein